MTEVQLTDAQQFIVDFVFDHWLENAEWPKKVLVRENLVKNGFESIEVDSDELNRFRDSHCDTCFDLNLLGFSRAQNAQDLMKYLVEFVNFSVGLFLKTPTEVVCLTDEHLRNLSIDWSKEDFERYNRLYLEWAGSLLTKNIKNRDGHWVKQIGVKCLDYRDVQSIEDYAARRRRIATAPANVPSSEHLAMARWILDKWRTSGNAPCARDVVLSHKDEYRNPVYIWKRMPWYMFGDDRSPEKLHPLKVRIDALGVLWPETESDLRSYWRLTRAIRDIYIRDTSRDRIPICEVAIRASMDEKEAIRLAEVSGALGVDFFLSRREEGSFIVPEQELFILERIGTFEEFRDYLEENWQRIHSDSLRKNLFGLELKEQPKHGEIRVREFSLPGLRDDLNISIFTEMPFDEEMCNVLVQRMEEAHRCYKANAHLAATILCGSVLEGICLAFGKMHPERMNRAYQKRYQRSPGGFREWTLKEWVDVLGSKGDFSPNVTKLSDALRDFRNYVHPFEQASNDFVPDEKTSKYALQIVVDAAEELIRAHERIVQECVEDTTQTPEEV